jgi:hypothetical protein
MCPASCAANNLLFSSGIYSSNQLLSIKPFTEAGKEFNGSSPRCFVRIGITYYFMTMQETQQSRFWVTMITEPDSGVEKPAAGQSGEHTIAWDLSCSSSVRDMPMPSKSCLSSTAMKSCCVISSCLFRTYAFHKKFVNAKHFSSYVQ